LGKPIEVGCVNRLAATVTGSMIQETETVLVAEKKQNIWFTHDVFSVYHSRAQADTQF
jgi:hypothetical protein